jgi:hypothetical protein
VATPPFLRAPGGLVHKIRAPWESRQKDAVNARLNPSWNHPRVRRGRRITPAANVTRNSAKNMKNINLAISAASPGMSENPNIAARIAATKQTTALCSMILSHSVTQHFRIFPDEGQLTRSIEGGLLDRQLR